LANNNHEATAIVDVLVGVTLLGAGDFAPAVLAQALIHAPVVVAADGGAVRASQHNLDLAAVIGDLDSIDAETLATLPRGKVHRIPDQETTDFDKCLARIRAPFILAVGFTGARLDHQMAVFSTLVQRASSKCLVIGSEDIAFIAPPSLHLRLAVGTRLSLFPMGPVSGESNGLRWPIAGIAFAPDGKIGTSNEVVAPDVDLRFSARKMLVLLPRSALAETIRAVSPEFDAKAAARGE
jgi:thiamine pyrophosphokinase